MQKIRNDLFNILHKMQNCENADNPDLTEDDTRENFHEDFDGI